MKIDVHNHVRTRSNFQENDFNRIVDTVSKKLGFYGTIGLINMFGENSLNYEKVLGLTGYDRTDIGNAFYVPEKEVLVIKGQEVPTQQGHLLVLGLKKGKQIKINKSLEETIKEAKDENTVIIGDHPFGFNGIGEYLEKNPEILSQIDGLETHNGESCLWIPGKLKPYSNKKAQEFYDKHLSSFPHLSAITSSDSHSFREIGSSYMKINILNINDNEGLISSLRENLRKSYNQQRHNSYLGAVEHTAYIAAILGLMKFGLYPTVEEQK